MRHAVIAFAVLLFGMVVAGCGAKVADEGGDPCSYTKPCGSGFVCDFTEPMGSDCIPADGDLDGDGLDNAHDFCDHMPGGSDDEDHDGLGDICDPCPIAPPPASPDSDHDTVESPCDPYPDDEGDSIMVFDGFNGAIASNWTATPASAWQIEGGELVATTTGGTPATMTIPLTITTDHFGLFIAYRIDSVPTDEAIHSVAITAADKSPAGVATFTCGSTRGISDQLGVNTDMGAQSLPETDLFDTAGLFQLTGEQDGATAGCVVIGDTVHDAVEAKITAGPMSTIGISVDDVTARIEYVLVAGHGTSPPPGQ